ncbi:MAG: hypothetical protein IRY92_08570, partial [Dactylosporangium sp.]|nr:hypothetical protein [Dactylosporangium sp.]
ILAALRAGTLAEEALVPIGRAILAAREEGRATMREGRAGDGETRDGRTRDGVTVFKSAGSGAQDLFAAVAAYRAYLAGRDGGAA